jgi:hypothetical protein
LTFYPTSSLLQTLAGFDTGSMVRNAENSSKFLETQKFILFIGFFFSELSPF